MMFPLAAEPNPDVTVNSASWVKINSRPRNFQILRILSPYLNTAEAEAGILEGSLIKGTLRISAKSTSDGFRVRDSSTLEDIYIACKDDRNRALNVMSLQLE